MPSLGDDQLVTIAQTVIEAGARAVNSVASSIDA